MPSLYQCQRKITSSCLIIGGVLAYRTLWEKFWVKLLQDRLEIVAEDIFPETQF